MKIGLHILAILFSTIFISCNNVSPEKIEETIQSGVVLVQNRSYYEVILPNGNSLYFSGFDDEGDIKGLVTEEDSVEFSIGYGTGFFISDKGEIATNAHVVSNTKDEKEVSKSFEDILDLLKSVVVLEYQEKSEQLEKLNQLVEYAFYSSDVSVDEYNQVKSVRDALVDEMEEYSNSYQALDKIRARDLEIEYHNVVSIAYNDTHITNSEDFEKCVVKTTDKEHDLAILQLKDKVTPNNKFVFTLAEEEPLESYSLRDKFTKTVSEDKNNTLYMMGFNLGPILAITEEGILAQFNHGTISQKTKDRLMYSIPTLPGSSGSPVVNRKYELVAINYAGVNKTQNFNYGIRVKHLKNLIDE